MTADPERALREAERRDDHECGAGGAVLRICQEMVDAGIWRPVRDLVVRTCERAEGDVGHVTLTHGLLAGKTLKVSNVHSHRLARLAANCARTLAPGVPWGEEVVEALLTLSQKPGGSGITSALRHECDATDVLFLYTRALQLWWPIDVEGQHAGWWRWLTEELWETHDNIRHDGWRTTWQGAVVRRDGSVECGPRCPTLPWVPEREHG